MKRWFGNSDHKTSEGYFYGDAPYHMDQFKAVYTKLAELSEAGEVDLIYVDDESPRKVVAYRFKSDAAYNAHRGEVHGLGMSLGRGIWEPFRDKYLFDQFFRQPAVAA